MKWFLMVLMFSSVGMAKIDIVYGIDGQAMQSMSFDLDQKSKVFSFDKMTTMCEMDLVKGTLVVFCDHKENGSGAMIECNGQTMSMIFQNKKAKKRYVAKITCAQEKI